MFNISCVNQKPKWRLHSPTCLFAIFPIAGPINVFLFLLLVIQHFHGPYCNSSAGSTCRVQNSSSRISSCCELVFPDQRDGASWHLLLPGLELRRTEAPTTRFCTVDGRCTSASHHSSSVMACCCCRVTSLVPFFDWGQHQEDWLCIRSLYEWMVGSESHSVSLDGNM